MLRSSKNNFAVHLQGFTSAFAKHDSSAVATMGESFDYKSVMMYDEYAFSKVRTRCVEAFRHLELFTNAPNIQLLYKEPNIQLLYKEPNEETVVMMARQFYILKYT
jgi:hypothetical protein